MRIELVKNVAGQRIYFYPTEGRPSSTPTVELKDKYGTTVTAASATYVTQDTVDTTVAVANAVNDRTLTLTSVAGIEYRGSYLLTNSLLQTEWVRVYSVNSSSNVVEFDEPLKFVHDTSATFQGCSFYRTMQTTEVDTLYDLQRARASYTVGGKNYIREVNYDIVLTPLHNPLTVEYIKRYYPDIMSLEPSETQGSDLLDIRNSAWNEVLKGIRKNGYGWRPALVRTPEGLEEWALAEFDKAAFKAGIGIIRNASNSDPLEVTRYLSSIAEDKKREALSTLEFVDLDEDDAPSDDEQLIIEPDLIA